MTSEIHGRCDTAFDKLADDLTRNIDSGDELGASVVVDIDGDTVVDIWGGYTDGQRSQPWTTDTITNVWSSTKTVTSLAVLVLVDRGLIDVDAPVADYWPEFAANGKENVRIRHLLSHTSGVSGWQPPFAIEQLYDWPRASSHLAGQKTWWEPGTASGYHAINFGQLLGEVVLRVTGRTLPQFVADDIAGPLEADFQIGAREADWHRISDVVPPPPLPFNLSELPEDNLTRMTLDSPPLDAANANTAAWRRADLGAVNGHGNARSLARMMSVIARGGTVDNHALLSPATIDLIFEQQSDGTDLVLLTPIRFGTGFALADPSYLTYPFPGRVCFWGGWGGSIVVMDLEHKTTIAYTMNKMGAGILGSERTETYLQTISESLEKVFD